MNQLIVVDITNIAFYLIFVLNRVKKKRINIHNTLPIQFVKFELLFAATTNKETAKLTRKNGM